MLSDDYDHHDIVHEEMLLSDNSIENALSSLANFSDKSPAMAGPMGLAPFLESTASRTSLAVQKRLEAKYEMECGLTLLYIYVAFRYVFVICLHWFLFF
jgi:hypothetical protein